MFIHKPSSFPGVYISGMTLNPTVNRQLLYGNRNHELTFNLRIQADSPSASISGSNLWQLVIFASNQLNGLGPRRGQAVVTLTQSQLNAALTEGGQINFNNLQVKWGARCIVGSQQNYWYTKTVAFMNTFW